MIECRIMRFAGSVADAICHRDESDAHNVQAIGEMPEVVGNAVITADMAAAGDEHGTARPGPYRDQLLCHGRVAQALGVEHPLYRQMLIKPAMGLVETFEQACASRFSQRMIQRHAFAYATVESLQPRAHHLPEY